MYYLKEFNSHSDYETYMSGEPLLPNVSLCNNQNDVHYNTDVQPFELVDLALPSGILWANRNIGANTEVDYGLYFAWGETKGYNDISSIKRFQWSDYELGYGSGEAEDMTKYNSEDGKTVLETVDDAAYQATNGVLRMPTIDEINELLDTTYVTNEWVENYNSSGVNGMLFTSVSNGNTLFIPASGGIIDVIDERDEYGYIWSSSINTNSLNESYFLGFMRNNAWTENDGARCNGFNVRGVKE